jgi:hypothetical protein
VNLYDIYATLISIHNASGLHPPIVSATRSFMLTQLIPCSIVTMTLHLPPVCG